MTTEEIKEAIMNERSCYKTLYDAICKLQHKYCDKLQEENLEGNHGTSGDYLDFIKDLQELLT